MQAKFEGNKKEEMGSWGLSQRRRKEYGFIKIKLV